MVIDSFTTDANDLFYPAITICRHGYNPGQSNRGEIDRFVMKKVII